MKTLLILRHAKTRADAPHGDWERRLTERGERDAATMGRVIASLPDVPEVIVTSDAVRARQTAEIVVETSGLSAPITLDPRIYAAEWRTLLVVVRGLPDDAGCVLIVGHNPGFEELAAALAAGDAAIDHLPTAGLVQLDFEMEAWRAIRRGAGKLQDIHTPKEHRS
ncbi:MAG: SixA phosphatase family protein [Thermomicrobiales bacterium]